MGVNSVLSSSSSSDMTSSTRSLCAEMCDVTTSSQALYHGMTASSVVSIWILNFLKLKAVLKCLEESMGTYLNRISLSGIHGHERRELRPGLLWSIHSHEHMALVFFGTVAA